MPFEKLTIKGIRARPVVLKLKRPVVARIATLTDRDTVRVFHEAGYLSDARHAARRLPPSEERDAYLLALPGR